MERNIFLERRSIFPVQFKEETIDDAIIKAILEEANNAPSHKNTEPWRFKVYAGSGKGKLSEILGDAYQKAMPEGKFSPIKHKKLKKKPLLSSHIIGIGMKRHEDSGLPEWEELAAVACSVQSIYLACTARNLGCYWSSPKFLCNDPSILSWGEGIKSLGLVYIGVPKDELEFKVEKGGLSDKLEWIT